MIAGRNRKASLKIGVLSPLLSGTFSGEVLTGVVEVAEQRSAQVVAIQTLDLRVGGQTAPQPSFDSPTSWDRVAGYIVLVNAVERPYLEAILRARKPLVLVSNTADGLGCPEVRPDNWGGTYAAVSHLLGHGHRRIAFVGNLRQADIRERFAAWRAALVDHGVEPEQSLVFEVPDNLEDSGAQAASRLIEAGLPATATMLATDYNAIGFLNALQAAGIAVPESHALFGFDDVEGASAVSPTISTVHQDIRELGRRAAGLLLDMLEGIEVPPGVHPVATSLRVRESCGCGSPLIAEKLLGVVDPEADPFFRLRRRLGFFISAHALPSEEDEAMLEAILGAARQLSERSLEAKGALARLAGQLIQLNPRWTTVSHVVECLRLFESELAALEPDRYRPDWLEAEIADFAMAASRAAANHLSNNAAHLHRILFEDYELSMTLLSSHAEDPRSLEWLANTRARAACLAFWSPPKEPWAAPGGMLRIFSSYSKDKGGPLVLPDVLAAEEFPPQELFEEVQWSRGELCVVLPVKTKSRDWGVIAMVGPVETTSVSCRDFYFQANALLSVSIEREAMLEALREHSQNLSRAYHRERELVEEVRRSEERYALAARAANDGLWDWDLESGSVFFSERWKALLGYNEQDIGSSPEEWFSRVHPEDSARLADAIARCLSGEADSFSCEHRLCRADGAYRWMACHALLVRSNDDGRPLRLVGSVTDVTEQRELEEKLRFGALHDALTGLANRTLFMDRLTQALARAKRRPEETVAVLFIDLDGFKQVNDTLGHLAGDLLLIQVARRLSSRLRATDTAARFGGDEFAVLLEGMRSADDVNRLVEELKTSLRQPYELEGTPAVVGATVGVAIATPERSRPEDLLADADASMYLGKLQARGLERPVGSAKSLRRQLEGASELRRALAEKEFEVIYEPIFELQDRRLVGFEAAVRWKRQNRMSLGPAQFLAVAEEAGLAGQLGRWLLEECGGFCDSLQGLKGERQGLWVEICVSSPRFWQRELVACLGEHLAEVDSSGRRLVVGVTEQVAAAEPAASARVAKWLADHGVELVIDDFGSGHLSLADLDRLGAFLFSLATSITCPSASSQLIRGIVAMASSLGAKVRAKQIASPDQAACLADAGVWLGQGPHLGSALSADRALQAVEDALFRSAGRVPNAS